MLISLGEGGNWKLCKNEKKRLEGEKRGDVEERGVRGEKWKRRVMMSVFAL